MANGSEQAGEAPVRMRSPDPALLRPDPSALPGRLRLSGLGWARRLAQRLVQRRGKAHRRDIDADVQHGVAVVAAAGGPPADRAAAAVDAQLEAEVVLLAAVRLREGQALDHAR